jgi:predicted enzyme related to lactoylglutathione lyase
MFSWYELRTTDTASAQAFYADVLDFQVRSSPGADLFCVAEQPVAGLSTLPERAAARGAPAHWLGHIGVEDVDGVAQRILALGGEPLGPMRKAADGTQIAVLRDPFGSVLALRSKLEPVSRGVVVWHELNTRDRERAWSMYADLFGWTLTQTLDLGLDVGPYPMFAWDQTLRSVGGMVNSALLPHVHTHWLFYFSVRDLEDTLCRVRARGGKVNGPLTLPGGDRVAQCDDPQGAAFGLRESAALESG